MEHTKREGGRAKIIAYYTFVMVEKMRISSCMPILLQFFLSVLTMLKKSFVCAWRSNLCTWNKCISTKCTHRNTINNYTQPPKYANYVKIQNK